MQLLAQGICLTLMMVVLCYVSRWLWWVLCYVSRLLWWGVFSDSLLFVVVFVALQNLSVKCLRFISLCMKENHKKVYQRAGVRLGRCVVKTGLLRGWNEIETETTTNKESIKKLIKTNQSIKFNFLVSRK